MENIISLNHENIEKEHICCAFSDKKCSTGYELKKKWLKNEFEIGYSFRRIDARAKVFIEYGPAELAWVPINAPGYFNINCFWVSGKYKNIGYGKELLKLTVNDATAEGKNGLVTVAGTKKMTFMSDTGWLLKQGFVECDKISSGFSLFVYKTNTDAINPFFAESVKTGKCKNTQGLTVYYADRCPFTDYYVNTELVNTAKNRNIPLNIIKFQTAAEARKAPSPATIFSLFNNGEFVTQDISVCLDSRFDKFLTRRT